MFRSSSSIIRPWDSVPAPASFSYVFPKSYVSPFPTFYPSIPPSQQSQQSQLKYSKYYETPVVESWKQQSTKLEPPIEHTNGLKIVIVLDESGSMDTIKEQMIKAINDLIKEQRTVKGRPATLTLVKFNDRIDRVIKNQQLDTVNLLSDRDYCPNGSTALFDALGSTINWFRYESDVLMVIVTDGLENASKDYNKNVINEMLDEKKQNRGWSYVYLSNNLENSSQGVSMGLNSDSTCSNVVVDQSRYGSYLSKNLNSAISNCRKYGMSVQSQLNK